MSQLPWLLVERNGCCRFVLWSGGRTIGQRSASASTFSRRTLKEKHVCVSGFSQAKDQLILRDPDGRQECWQHRFLHVTRSKQQLLLKDGGQCGGKTARRGSVPTVSAYRRGFRMPVSFITANIHLETGLKFKEASENC